jgi:hypothetical protein
MLGKQKWNDNRDGPLVRDAMRVHSRFVLIVRASSIVMMTNIRVSHGGACRIMTISVHHSLAKTVRGRSACTAQSEAKSARGDRQSESRYSEQNADEYEDVPRAGEGTISASHALGMPLGLAADR